MKKIIVILGPTATGKSDLAVRLARQLRGEVISADSRQVYRGLDIGTGKITKREMRGVPHHLLDIASPRRVFSVAKWQKLAEKKMAEIFSRGHLPIICGGTGLYIQSITNNVVFPEVAPDWKLRKKLNDKSADELFKILKKLDPERAKKIDAKNPVRLIRAIEIAKSLGKVPPRDMSKKRFDILQIGLILPPDKLKEKIEKRLEKRIRSGMLVEAQRLHKKGLSWKRMFELGLEYRYQSLFLQKKNSKKEFIEKLSTEIRQYARRQMTWFKRDKKIHWFSPDEFKKIERTAIDFLKSQE
jgi:tRNA dimethylallyltransferase